MGENDRGEMKEYQGAMGAEFSALVWPRFGVDGSRRRELFIAVARAVSGLVACAMMVTRLRGKEVWSGKAGRGEGEGE